jgi:hypothetical protein
MWTCPNCGRNFKNTNQDHSCIVTDLESHFLNKETNVQTVFAKLLEEVSNFGEFTINPVKSAILLTAESHFLAIKPKKRWIDIEFVLPYKQNSFPIHKVVQAQKKKWAHFVRLETPEEVDNELIGWLQEAFKISSI